MNMSRRSSPISPDLPVRNAALSQFTSTNYDADVLIVSFRVRQPDKDVGVEGIARNW